MVQRIIGIDLGVTASHRASILDPATDAFTYKNIAVQAFPAKLDELLAKARRKAGADVELIALLEATGMAWYPVSLYLLRHEVKVYRVNGRMTKALRRVLYPHARSDSIDSQVLAKLYQDFHNQLEPLRLCSGQELTLQRYCREFVRYRQLATALQNRMDALDKWVWNGLTKLVPVQARPWMRRNWYDPWQVVATDEQQLLAHWCSFADQLVADANAKSTGQFERSDKTEATLRGEWIPKWVERAHAITQLYAAPQALDIEGIGISMHRCLDQYTDASAQKALLQDTLIQPLYQQLYPHCPLESIHGIGAESAAIYMAFIHTINRFDSIAKFRQWCGMVPGSNQSGQAQSKGIHITQSGPDLIKATLYLNADTARQWDLQLAKLYYTQMVRYGKHHSQAVCACAAHLADRIYVVRKQNRPYQLRDLNNQPISPSQSHQRILEQFTVPDDVRERTNCRSRRRRDLTDE